MTTDTVQATDTAPQNETKSKSPFQGFYNNPLPHDYFGFLSPVGYRAPDETMAVLRPWLTKKQQEITDRPIRIVDFFSGYGANGLLLRTRLSMPEVSSLFAEGVLASQDYKDHQAFLAAPLIGADKVELTGLDIAPNALAYAHDTGLYQQVFDDNLLEGRPSPGLAKAAFDADIIIESGGHHEISAPIIDGLLGATNPNQRPPLIMSIARDFDTAPIMAVLEQHQYRARVLKPDFMLRRFDSEDERKERQARNVELGLPKGGALGDNVRYANLYWAEHTQV